MPPRAPGLWAPGWQHRSPVGPQLSPQRASNPQAGPHTSGPQPPKAGDTVLQDSPAALRSSLYSLTEFPWKSHFSGDQLLIPGMSRNISWGRGAIPGTLPGLSPQAGPEHVVNDVGLGAGALEFPLHVCVTLGGTWGLPGGLLGHLPCSNLPPHPTVTVCSLEEERKGEKIYLYTHLKQQPIW